MIETNDSVAPSRQGDMFHYRWAARRCLKLLDFNSPLKYITIEGSSEKLAGEFVIDIAEYSHFEKVKAVEYFQLKHSTTQLDKDFTLSLLKNTFEGFAKRFTALQKQPHDYQVIKFSIITNRPMSIGFKDSIKKLSKGEDIDKRFKTTIKNYTKLSDKSLKIFCQSLSLEDGEGNYDAQKYAIHKQLAELTSSVDTAQINNLVALIQEKVVAPRNNKIIREDVLRLFGVSSEKELFPVLPEFETLDGYVTREQHAELYSSILTTKTPIIIKAGGGVGKSIVCCQLANDFSDNHFAIAYDCFGNGKYRRLSEKRHRPSDAFIQISNELAKRGLCEPLIPQIYDQDDRLMRSFLERLRAASASLKNNNEDAVLVILIDAADNAEMAADEFGDTCFASQLLKEEMPEGCIIVLFSRPERIHLLKPKSSILQLELKSFSEQETLEHLKVKYPKASIADGTEFQRLTDGNPRVQANALSFGGHSIKEVLLSLSTLGSTVNGVIEQQLENAVANIKDNLPNNFHGQIDTLCTGLANLPPFIPLHILSVTRAMIISGV